MEKDPPKLKKQFIIIGAVLGLLLMLLPGFFKVKESKKEEISTQSTEYYSELLENKLEELLSEAKGVGKVRVVVTLDSSVESVLAQNSNRSESSIAVDYVIISTNEGEEAVPLCEIYPKVRGVAVVCTGGTNAEVKERVTSLVSSALGISSNKIAVSG